MNGRVPDTLTPDHLTAELSLRRPGAGRAGAERIALLRAVRDTGSISAAARLLGLSYKGAWDAVRVLNNLFPAPLVVPTAGGRDGGASRVTPAGEAVLAAFGRAEEELSGVVRRLEADLAAGGHSTPSIWSLLMKTSARNALRGTVARVVAGAVNSEVTLDIGGGIEIVATVTRESVEDLGLSPGVPALALIKASFVILARDEGERLRTSARNCLAGMVARREDGPVSSEVTLQLNAGRTLTATLTRESADALALSEGTPALALIKASHVILAVE